VHSVGAILHARSQARQQGQKRAQNMETHVDLLIPIGAVISVIGIIGIALSIVQVRRAKRMAANDDELRAKIQAVLPLNLGAFLVSVIGLMCVVIGVILT
jgi:hypothetical protein